MNYDNKNFILAIVLSMLIIFGWQYFYAQPLQEKLTGGGTDTTTTTPQPDGTVPDTAPPAPVKRDDAIAASPRVPIETASVKGSINLRGAQFDDLHLIKYRETIDPNSPTIVFLSPAGTPGALFAEQGFVPATGTLAKLPDSKAIWTAPEGAKLTEATPVTLTWDNGEGLIFSRKIEIADEYMFTVTQTVENKSAAPVALIPYARIQRQDTPVVAGYWVFFEGMLGWLGDSLQEIHYKDVAEQKEPQKLDSQGGWLGFTDKYWAAAIVPDQSKPVTASFLHQRSSERDLYQTDYLAKDALIVQPGASATYRDQLFAGAKVVKTIDTIGTKNGIAGFDYMVDWGWFYFLTKPFFYLLDWLKGLVGNFGIAILLATVLVKLAVFPLANKSYASMSKMKKLQPEMEKLKQEFPDDRMKQQQGMMELYKREKVSPLSGCLPVVVQIPIFFALYKVILTSIELRHAPSMAGSTIFPRPTDESLQPLRPHSLDAAAYPHDRHLADHHGHHHVAADAPEPDAARPCSGKPVQLDAGDLHLHAGLIPRRPRHLLGLEQHALDPAAVVHHEAPRRRDRLLRQHPGQPALPQEEGVGVSEAFTKDQIDAGRRLFGGPSRFMLGVAQLGQLPEVKGVEIAFAGRSNVGKSSLINALTGMRELARASNTPGRTRELNFFNVNDALTLVDMPGYGFAKASKADVKQWQAVLKSYLRGRPGLTRAFVLIDSRHGILKADEEMFELLDESAVAYQVVLTKIDKIKPQELQKVFAKVDAAIRKHAAAFPFVHATSSEKGTGIPELRAEIAGLL